MPSEEVAAALQEYGNVFDKVEDLIQRANPGHESVAHVEAASLFSAFADRTAAGLAESSTADRSTLEQLVGKARCQEGLQYLIIGDLERGKAPLIQGGLARAVYRDTPS